MAQAQELLLLKGVSQGPLQGSPSTTCRIVIYTQLRIGESVLHRTVEDKCRIVSKRRFDELREADVGQLPTYLQR